MTNKIALVLISLFLITHCAWSMDFKNHPDYKLILKEAELGDNLVRSGKIYQALEYINVDSLSEKTKLEDETNKAILDEGNFSFRENYKKLIFENIMAKYDKDICFPEKTIITEFYRDEISNSFLPDTKFILTVHKNSKININLSDSIFNSPIPDGATVGDHRT